MNKYILRNFGYRLYNPLRFTKTICNNYTCPSLPLVFDYPILNVIVYLRGRFPFVYWKSKSRFGNKCMTSNRFKLSAYAIVYNFIVAADYPSLSTIFYSYLRRADDVARRMKRH